MGWKFSRSSTGLGWHLSWWPQWCLWWKYFLAIGFWSSRWRWWICCWKLGLRKRTARYWLIESICMGRKYRTLDTNDLVRYRQGKFVFYSLYVILKNIKFQQRYEYDHFLEYLWFLYKKVNTCFFQCLSRWLKTRY